MKAMLLGKPPAGPLAYVALLSGITIVLLLLAFLLRPPPLTSATPHTRVVVDGLLNPIGLAALPDGSLLVAESGTGNNDLSAGVSLITPGEQVGRFISGLPSSRDSGDLAGVALVALAPAGDQLYVGNFNQRHLWTLPISPGESLELPAQPLLPAQLTPAMQPLNNVYLVNPFDMTFDAEGVPVVADASGNGVARELPDGTTRFIHRFDRLPLPDTPDSTRLGIESVPTGIERVGAEYYVTLTGGCPYPHGSGHLVAIDEQRNQRTVINGLDMPIDIEQGPDGTLWLLEFARFTPDASCFSGTGYQADTGRLSRLLPDGSLEPVLEQLNYPGAVLAMPDGSLYISEVFPGRVLHITFGDPPPTVASGLPPVPLAQPAARTEPAPADYDRLLQAVIARENLEPFPGRELREGDTPIARLGQALFFDPILSGDQNIACATCHHPTLAMGDGLALPIGTGGHGLGPARTFLETITLGDEASTVRRQAGTTDPASGQTSLANPFNGTFVPRNAPTILNSALFPSLFWDSRVAHYGPGAPVQTPERLITAAGLTDALQTQALFPVTSEHEMAGATLGNQPPQAIRTALLERLRHNPAYNARFRAVWPADLTAAEQEQITLERVGAALAAFQRRFIYTEAPWDDYLAGHAAALSRQQKRGALLFYGQLDPLVNCASCHSGNVQSDFAHHNVLVPQLGPGKGHGSTGREDWGRAGVTFDLRDRYAFRTPSLRNVELTAPYFHDGAFATLTATIRHHANIWHSASSYDPAANAIPPTLYSSLHPFDPLKQGASAAARLRYGLPLSDEDIADLVAFLHSLTDPAARDLSEFIPQRVPSGLPLDPLPSQALPAADTDDTASAPDPPADPANIPPDTHAPAADSLPALHLRNVAGEVGLNFRHGAFREAVYQDPVAAMGAGLCWIDYNRDGWLDLYLVNSHAEDEQALWEAAGGLPTNALYRNEQGQFVDVSHATGTDLALRGNGCVAADFDRDGWSDLYITADGPNALLWNQRDGTFTEGAAAAGVAAPEWNSAAVVGDLNGDGWPDMFVASYIDLEHTIPRPSGAFPQDYYGLPDRLYLSQGPDAQGRVRFQEATEAAGLLREERGLGALLSDLDQDGDLDLYIANDGQPNRLYTNQPQPDDPAGLGFRLEDARDAAVGDSGSGMGIAGGDFDGDGWSDLVVTNWERELNAVYRNQFAEEGRLVFRYSTFRIGMMGLGNGKTGWGTALLDIDHDTDQDLLIVNGRVPVTNLDTDPELTRLYRNLSYDPAHQPARTGHFRDWTEATGLAEVGPLLARGSAVADYDNDGDLDIAMNTIAGGAVLLENNGPHANWLHVELGGFHPGARLAVTLPDGRTLLREWYVGSSYLASEDPRLHVGLGEYSHIPRLTVFWPDGSTTTRRNVAANQRLLLAP